MAGDTDTITLAEYAMGEEQISRIETVLEQLVDIGVHSVLVIDMAGNIIALRDNGRVRIDVYSLAALAAANFGAVEAMARLVGEEEFSLLFHKGEHESLHFLKINSELLMLSLFGPELTLGLLRIKAGEAAAAIRNIYSGRTGDGMR
uniref:Roadblock/LC7 domain-containing protein n=1 Tax=Desulfatirhabdium butyrativorans TaxID=340467 RepID=A0A7C4VS22_9BACT